jgi:hypothetical protein
LNSNNGRPSDDELHASLYALLHDGDFGKDEPADEETVRREISRIMEEAVFRPATTQEPPAESPQESQDLPPGQQRRHLVAPPIRPGHPKSPRRAHPRRPARKPTMSSKNAPAASEKLSSPHRHGAYRVAMILVLACAVGAAAGFLTYLASHSVPSALLTATAGIAASARLFDSIIGTADERHTSNRNNRGDS